MSASVALVPLAFSPVDCVIRNFNADIRARYPDAVFFLHTDDILHWVSWGIFQGAEYFDLLDAEDAKERRKAMWDDDYSEEEEEAREMDGPDWYI